MDAPYNDDGPRVPEGQTPTYNDSTPHDIAMFGMAWRIRWLERHRHWWIRSIKGGGPNAVRPLRRGQHGLP